MNNEKSLSILRDAMTQSQQFSDYGKIRTFEVEGRKLYYAGDLAILDSVLMSLLKGTHKGSEQFIDLYIKEMAKKEYNFIFSGISPIELSLARRIIHLGRKVVFLIHSGIKKEPLLQNLVREVKGQQVLIISQSMYAPKQADTEMHALFAYMVRAALITDCHANYNPRSCQWSSELFNICKAMSQQEKPLFIAPWRDEHPMAHLVLAHKYGAQQIPDTEDPEAAFAPISYLS